jgi:hypothetical protein
MTGLRRPRWIVTFLGVTTVACVLPAGMASAAARGSEFCYTATAYGTRVTIGNALKSGPSALAALGCTSRTGRGRTNTIASLNAPPLLTAGAIDTSAASTSATGSTSSVASSQTAGINLLAGLVTAEAVTSVSTTTDSASGFQVSAAGTSFVGLSIAGQVQSATPPANTTVPLPGVGYVVLNQQVGKAGTTSGSLTVIGIHVVLTVTSPLGSAGSQVIVSYAHSGMTGPVTALLSGTAFGSYIAAGGTLTAGHSFPEGLDCLGTNGVVRTNAAAALSVPGAVSSGTISDTAVGTANASTLNAETTSSIEGLNLLGGLVTATAIKADVVVNGANPLTFTDKSAFLGLSVAGVPNISSDPPANTQIALPGVGTLWLHKVVRTASSIHVVMIELDVTASGLPVPAGAVIEVASATVGVH